ncbi:hypothetical protein TIFTF001_009162 [Ficus carica]|uniref:Peptidase S9 prolyl oligopeptidase catalytic domain-containing protein n=1 Tax=Ficus carica TaxID=3494 RepID=A0AA88D139_FICCA|nr:hypothetical protein TIFTF001_009162 [Ficus carica]
MSLKSLYLLFPSLTNPHDATRSALARATTCFPHVRSSFTAYPPKRVRYKCRSESPITATTTESTVDGEREMAESVDTGKLRDEFLKVLRSRRSGEVPLSVETAELVTKPLYQEASTPLFSEAMASCPKADVEKLKDLLKEENLHLITEAGEQGRLPVLIVSLKEESDRKRPAVVFLHSTNKCKEWLRPLLEAYASRGYIAIAIDSRYHGERASHITTYKDALISAWKKGDTMPFIFDTVWDLIKLADYLTGRKDIDPTRIGITGESLGGMHAWFAAFADTRYSVVAPIIGVQSFGWAVENDKWQARVDSIKPVFEEARIDLGKSVIDKEVVKKASYISHFVWDRIAPGLASEFDSPYTVPAIAPRPLLILNGAEDPRCPVAGLEVPNSSARKAWENAQCLEYFKFKAQLGIGHQMTPEMVKEASDCPNPVEQVVSESGMEESVDADKLRSEFLKVLRSRRSGGVPLAVEPAKPVTNPLYQEVSPPTFSEAMASCPKANIENLNELLQEENLYLITEAGEQGRLPVLFISMKEESDRKRPAVVFLHSTTNCKEWLRPLLEAYASRGYIAIAIDSRYHGERASCITTYENALVSAWKKGDTMPFIYDTVWDLMKLADYLTERKDIDPTRIGITGESLGGMHAWFAAFADTRYSVVAPIIGVQGFGWAVENDKWQARVNSIKPVFEEARDNLGKSEIDREVVWDKIAPGLASEFDAPYSIPAIAPRPLLILNAAKDQRCPIAGLEVPNSRVHKAYEDAQSVDNFKLIVQPRIWHQMTPETVKQASDWFDKYLMQ